MGDKRIALRRVAWGGRVAQGQVQAQCWVEGGGFEVARAEDCFLIVRVLGVDVDADFGLEVRGHCGAAPDELPVCARPQMAPWDASRGHLSLGEPEQLGHGRALGGRGFVLRNAFALKERDRRGFGRALGGCRLSHLVHHRRKRTSQLEPFAPVVPLRAKGVPVGFTECERLAVLAGIGAALVTCLRGCALPIGAQTLAWDETKVVEAIDRHGGDRVDHCVTAAVAEGTPSIFARHRGMQAGKLPGAMALVAVVQIATQWGVIVIGLHLGGHFEDDEASRIVAASASGALRGCTQSTGEAQVHRGADEPTETAGDIALRGARNGMGDACVGREPPARRFGKRRRTGVAVVRVEALRMGDQGVEIKGRELLGGKRYNVSAHSRTSLLQEGFQEVLR